MSDMNLESPYLWLLSNTHNSDKLEHGYIQQYIDHLPGRNDCKKILEIGAYKGESLKIWKNYFPDADIYTLENFYYPDSVSKQELQQQGFYVIEGNQEDVGLLNSIPDEFDVIIDDGSHLPDHQQITFKHLFTNNLASEGLYVVEDLHTNLDEHFWHNIDNDNDTALTALLMLKSKIQWENKYFSLSEFKNICNLIDTIHIYENETENDYKSMIGFLHKKK